jgi:hypothetical protein
MHLSPRIQRRSSELHYPEHSEQHSYDHKSQSLARDDGAGIRYDNPGTFRGSHGA